MAKTLGPVKRKFSPWDNPDAVPFIRFENVTKRFGDFVAVNNLTLDIYEREFFSLLGPSGCGKTTLMRMLAGFEEPTEGRILLQGKDISGVPPYKRPTNMMFQSYALFPHMSVEKNVAFGLEQDGLPKADIVARVEEMLRLVKLTEFAKRKPSQLSGGQRQRVALARALVNKPKVLLLDEPLGALDLKLREQMQEELKSLQKALGITFVFVTHDQGEALSMADRIAVFNNGRIVQAGTPQEIYNRPQNRFVADFVGSSNVVAPEIMAAFGGERRWASLRPESIRLADKSDKIGVAARIETASFLGSATRLGVEAEGTRLHVMLPAGASVPETGSDIRIVWNPGDVHYMDQAA